MAVQHTIIGVMPEGFFGTFVGYGFQFWVPASMEDSFEGGGYKLESRDARWSEGFAFLKPGVTIEQAQAELSAIASRLAAAYPDTNRGRGFKLYPLWQTPFNGAGTMLPTLRISLVVACLVLLIACANAGNLLLVRSFSRRHEMTVRLSLGAGRLRLLRQLLTEGFDSGDCRRGGWTPAGILVPQSHQAAVPGFAWDHGQSSRRNGLARARAERRCLPDHDDAVRAGSGDAGAQDRPGRGHEVRIGRRGGRPWKNLVRSVLVLVQVSLSFLLLVGAGLLLKSLRAMQTADVGFTTRGVLTTAVDMISAGYDGPRIRNFQDQLLSRAESLGGVESAVWARTTPFSYRSYPSASIAVDGFVLEPGEQPVLDYNEVGPGYLATMGIPLLSGRDIAIGDDETAMPVAVVNETMVRRFWRGEDPVGKRLQVKGRWLRVIGVAKDAKYASLLENCEAVFLYTAAARPMGGQSLLHPLTAGRRELATALCARGEGPRSEPRARRGHHHAGTGRSNELEPARERSICSRSSAPWRCCWLESDCMACSPTQSRRARASWRCAWPWEPARLICCES
jgi:hypothetical protein